MDMYEQSTSALLKPDSDRECAPGPCRWAGLPVMAFVDAESEADIAGIRRADGPRPQPGHPWAGIVKAVEIPLGPTLAEPADRRHQRRRSARLSQMHAPSPMSGEPGSNGGPRSADRNDVGLYRDL